MHTEEKKDFYGTKSYAAGLVVVLDRILAFDEGKDFTSYLLSDEFDLGTDNQNIQSEKKENDAKPYAGHFQTPEIHIHQTQNQSQNQSTTINIATHFDKFEKLQWDFDEFRESLDEVDVKIEKALKETQDALDCLSPKSTKEEASKALNKVSRIKNAGTSIGRAVINTGAVINGVETLKKTYNGVAPLFGLPPL